VEIFRIIHSSMEMMKSSVWHNYDLINKLFKQHGNKPYIDIHNHPIGSEDLHDDTVLSSSLPSYGDLYVFMRDDSIGTCAMYQHNANTNKSEGMIDIRKTKKTPKSGIFYSEYAKGHSRAKDAELNFAQSEPELYNKFIMGSVSDILRPYFELTCNPQHSNVPDSDKLKVRQELLDDIAAKLHLQIKNIPAEDIYYEPGMGFLKDNNT
jgi:hypothetical protein